MSGLFSNIDNIEKKNIVKEKENNCSYFQRALGLGSCPKPSSITKEQHEECSWWRKRLGMCKKNKQTHVMDCDCKKCLKECKGIDMTTIDPLIDTAVSSTTDSSTTVSPTDSSTTDSSTDSSTTDSSTTVSTTDSSTTDSPTDSSTTDSSTTNSSTTTSPTDSSTSTLFNEQIKSITSAVGVVQNKLETELSNSAIKAKRIKEQAFEQAKQIQNDTLKNVNKAFDKATASISYNLKNLQSGAGGKTGGRKGNRKTNKKGNRKTNKKGIRKTNKKRTKRKGTKRKKRKGTKRKKRKGNMKTNGKGTKRKKRKNSYSKKYKIMKKHHDYHHRKH